VTNIDRFTACPSLSSMTVNFFFSNRRCSAFESEIDRLRITKRVRVCGECYERQTKSQYRT